jgi:two-component system, NtrC family, sensor kinase
MSECILIIDDSREIVKHLTEYVLPTFGYNTLYAFDGQTGLAYIREKKPDLVMLDFNLPEMTGIDVLQQMAKESISTPVVLMTGYGSELSAIEAFRLGAKDYLIKPFTVDEVIDTIERALVETRLLHDKAELAEQLRRVKVEMSRQTHEMNTLFNIGKAITSLLSVDDVLGRVLEAAIYLTNAEESHIWYGARPGEDGDIGAPSEKLPQVEVPVGQGFAGTVVQSGRPIYSNDVPNHPLHYRQIDAITGFFTQSILCVPLTFRGQPVGVLQLLNKRDGFFDEQDVERAQSIAAAVAIATTNAMLVYELDVGPAIRDSV